MPSEKNFFYLMMGSHSPEAKKKGRDNDRKQNGNFESRKLVEKSVGAGDGTRASYV